MAANFADNLSYFLCLKAHDSHFLGTIRTWNNLKLAFDGDWVWVKDLTFEQSDSIEVNSIPYKQLFYAEGGKLFLKNSLLPTRNIPALLWTSIERALPVVLPNFNHNYFGVAPKISLSLRASEQEQPAFAMLTSLATLKQYIETAPAIRLQKLSWAVINHNQGLLLGTPILPIQGEVFWRNNNFLLPVGYDFDLPILSQNLDQLLNESQTNWVVWQANNDYFLLPKSTLNQLSISSFRSS